jgi:hypothetical protein
MDRLLLVLRMLEKLSGSLLGSLMALQPIIVCILVAVFGPISFWPTELGGYAA